MVDIVVVNGARTAWAEYSGTPGFGLFKDVSAIDLCAQAAKAALQRSGVSPEKIGHTVVGNASQSHSDSLYGARHVALKAGVPIASPAVTVNRICGSGVESVAMGARLLKLGEAEFVLAGGMENMSQAPYVVRGLRGQAPRFGQGLQAVDALFESLTDPFCGLMMAQTAEKCAKKYGIPREAQDEFALRSHVLGAKCVQEGRFKDEIVAVKVKDKEIAIDDHIKPETTLEKLARLPAAFGKEGTVTAGNASGIVDGAAALVLTTADRAKADGLKPLGRIAAYAAVGVEPDLMGMGPAPAIRAVLKQAGLRQEEIDLFEINEAFAAQYLAVEKELGLDRNKVNVNGGAIAIGHPLGATGTRLVLTVLLELRRRKKRWGIASACIGGGQGIAMLLDAA